jgi:hypothetical protein
MAASVGFLLGSLLVSNRPQFRSERLLPLRFRIQSEVPNLRDEVQHVSSSSRELWQRNQSVSVGKPFSSAGQLLGAVFGWIGLCDCLFKSRHGSLPGRGSGAWPAGSPTRGGRGPAATHSRRSPR